MSRENRERFRNQTVCFRTTPEERYEIEARIKVSGMPKAQYYIQSLLHQKIEIVVGKYQSDRLSLEIRRLREWMEGLPIEDEKALCEPLRDCKALLEQLMLLMESTKGSTEISAKDFGSKK